MASTIPAPETKSKKKNWQNHRATVRYKCAPATTSKIHVCEDTEYQRAWVQDLSQGGMGLLVSRVLESGAVITVQLKSLVSHKNYELQAHIVHITMQPNGDWIAGCEFVDKLTSEQLDDLL